jgi:hypothetical protein
MTFRVSALLFKDKSAGFERRVTVQTGRELLVFLFESIRCRTHWPTVMKWLVKTVEQINEQMRENEAIVCGG